MKPLSGNVQGIQRSPIRQILDSAKAYPDAIELEIGQPDFDPPVHVIEAAVDAARNRYTGYTANAGIMELREAICTKLARENALQVGTDEIMVTVGAMQAIFSSMAVLLEPGDQILLPDPGYGNFESAARLLNAEPIYYATLPERGFEPDFERLEQLVTPRTKAMLINSPSNPTGAVFTREVLMRCLAFCQKHDLYMISDETYDQLLFEGTHHSPAKWDDEGRVISVFTTSKTYAMTGWRIGYAVANPEIVRQMTKIQEPTVSCVNTVAQHAAVAALLGPQDCVAYMREQYRVRRDVAVQVAKELGLKVSNPRGAFYMLVDISAQDKCSLDFSLDLLDQERVAVGPGCAFGPICDRYVRISFCASESDLRKGLTRLARHLSASTPLSRILSATATVA